MTRNSREAERARPYQRAHTLRPSDALAAKTVRADPAVFSDPFITTFVDAAGLIVYLLIARALLGL